MHLNMWHAVEKAVIFDEEVQEVANKDEEEDPEPSSKRRKNDKATKGKRHRKMLTKTNR